MNDKIKEEVGTKRVKNVRLVLSEEEYDKLKRKANDMGIPMVGVLRLYIQDLP